MKRLAAIALLFIAPVCRADSISTVAADLRSLVDIPFRYGVATDLAENLMDAQLLASYASPKSLGLSIEAVVRAIGIDGTSYVGWASTNPITWLQSNVAIDPGASISFTPRALSFGEVAVATPEPEVWLMLLAVALAVGGVCGWMWLRGPMKKDPPRIDTPFGPVTEWARKQAAQNMLDDPEVKKNVEESLCKKHGSVAEGMAVARRQFPEAYEKQ